MVAKKLFEKTDPLSDALKRSGLEAFIKVAMNAGGGWAVDSLAMGDSLSTSFKRRVPAFSQRGFPGDTAKTSDYFF